MPEKIFLWGIAISQPMSILTNGLVAVVCFLFYRRLTARKDRAGLYHWDRFFLWIALATFLGGIGHGVEEYAGKSVQRIAWIFSGIALYMAEASALNRLGNQRLSRNLALFIKIKLGVYAILALFSPIFAVVEINTGIGMVGIVFLILWLDFLRNRRASSLWICTGIMSLIAVPIVKGLKLSIGTLFNHHDISHFIMVLSFFIIYKGVEKSLSGN